MGTLEGLAPFINGSGYAFGSVDGLASVQSAAADLSKNPGDPGLQAAYNAAYWNAVAAETALIPGVGAVYASKAFAADLVSISVNKISPLSEEGAGAYVSLMSNFAIMLSQGVAVSAVVGGAPMTIAIAGTTFVASELVDFASAILTTAGVYIDKATIGNYLAQGTSAAGINQNADGSYNVLNTGNSSLNIGFNGIMPQSTFTMNTVDIQAGNALYVPTVDTNGNITGFTARVPTDVYQYGNGTAGANFGNDASVATNVTDIPNSPAGASPTAVWNVPNVNGTSNNAVIVQYSDGTFGSLSGSVGNYTVQMKNVGAPLPGQSNEVSMTDDNGQISASINGSGATLDASNCAVSLSDGTSATQDGSNLQVTALSGSAFTLNGTNDQVSASGATMTLAMNANADIVGNNNVVTDVSGSPDVSGSHNDVSVSGAGASASVIGGDNDVSVSSNASGSTIAFGGTGTGADTLSVASGATGVTAQLGLSTSTLDLASDTSVAIDSVNGGGTVVGTTGDSATLSGKNITLDATAGQYTFTGTGGTADASNSTIDVTTGGSLNLAGSGDTVALGDGSTVTVGHNFSDTIENDANGQTISIDNGDLTLSGSTQAWSAGVSDTVAVAANGSAIATAYDSATDSNLTTVVDTAANGGISQIATTPAGSSSDIYDTTITNGSDKVLETETSVLSSVATQLALAPLPSPTLITGALSLPLTSVSVSPVRT